ncbi:4-amino-4-deoxy-L-arabinose-phosphoundecaprenol flippase subunit ArnF [compost metagenome]
MKGKSKVSYLFLAFSILFQSFASLLSKYAADSTNETNVLLLITNGFYLASLFCLLMQAVFWQFTLKKLELSIAYPVTALNNMIILFFSYFIFHEHVTFNNILGVFIMMTGVMVLNIKSDSQ